MFDRFYQVSIKSEKRKQKYSIKIIQNITTMTRRENASPSEFSRSATVDVKWMYHVSSRVDAWYVCPVENRIIIIKIYFNKHIVLFGKQPYPLDLMYNLSWDFAWIFTI